MITSPYEDCYSCKMWAQRDSREKRSENRLNESKNQNEELQLFHMYLY